MRKLIHTYIKAENAIEKVCAVLIIIALITMTLIMTTQTILRYFFATGLAWPEELTRLIFCYSVMIGSSVAIRRGSHLQMGIIGERLKGKAQPIYKLVIQVVCLLFYIYILKLSIEFAMNVTGATGALKLSYKYVYLCIPVGVVLMILSSIEQCLLEVWHVLKNEKFVIEGE